MEDAEKTGVCYFPPAGAILLTQRYRSSFSMLFHGLRAIHEPLAEQWNTYL